MSDARLIRAALALTIFLLFAGTRAVGQAGENSSTSTRAAEPATTQEQKPGVEPKGGTPGQDLGPKFKVRVNLVQVKVVVRDEKGEVVKNLEREDFQIYDQGKLQMISTFGVETPETLRKRAEESVKTQTEKGQVVVERSGMPQRCVALVLDDVHMETWDVLAVRAGAEKMIESMRANERIGIFSTSGQMTEEFTRDKEALKRKLKSLVARPLVGKVNSASSCPEVSYFMADQVINHNNSNVLKALRVEVLECYFHNDPKLLGAAEGVAESLLRQQLTAGDADNQASYRQLEETLRRLSTKPGERDLPEI